MNAGAGVITQFARGCPNFPKIVTAAPAGEQKIRACPVTRTGDRPVARHKRPKPRSVFASR